MAVTNLETWLALAAVGLAAVMLILLAGRLWLQFRDFWKWLS